MTPLMFQGDRCTAEEYLERFPDLAGDVEAAAKLLADEFLRRQSQGEIVSVEEFLTRFPRYRDQLAQLLHGRGSLGSAKTDAESVGPESSAEPLACLRPGEVFGPYQLLVELTGGGMGTLFLARDPEAQREVVLKYLRVKGLPHEGVERFRREIQAIGRLTHPHIIPLYDHGTCQGYLYFTTKYARGGNLNSHLKKYHSYENALSLMRKIALAVSCAHAKGIVHRDLKPANILLDESEEPLVADFGLAKFLDAAIGLTAQEQMLGTPNYMAPEQAEGRASEVEPPVDVWALGVILYELIAEERPFDAPTRNGTLRRIREDVPKPLSSFRSDLPRDLEILCLRCLDKDPGQRPSAELLAQCLSDLLAQRPSPLPFPAPRVGTTEISVGESVPLQGVLDPVVPAPQRRLTWRPIALAAFAILVILGIGKNQLTPKADPTPTEEVDLARDAAWAGLRQRLSNQDPVVLVGEEAPPWFSWLTEPGTLRPHGQDRGHPELLPFHQNQAISRPTLLELLEDIPCPHYRLHAEIQQTKGFFQGSCGVYFARTEGGKATPRHSTYAVLSFADRNQPHPASSAQPLGDETLRLEIRSLRRASLEETRVQIWSTPFVPAPGAWRVLEAEISPDQVRVTWSDLANPEERRQVQYGWDELPGRHLDRNHYQNLGLGSRGLNPHGGLGLFAHNASFLFRNVTVTPLP